LGCVEVLKKGSRLLWASFLAAKQIHKIGLKRTRKKLRDVSTKSPIARYAFYCCWILVWMPGDVSQRLHTENTFSLALMLAPIMAREIIHLGWVAYDLSIVSGFNEGNIYSHLRGMVDAFMSLLFGPSQWRNADLRARQKSLSQLVSKFSLAAEVSLLGMLLFDTLAGLFLFLFHAKDDHPSRISFFHVLKRVVLTRLYVHFLLAQRARIDHLMGKLRGCSKTIPVKILDLLLDPKKTVGLPQNSTSWSCCIFHALGL